MTAGLATMGQAKHFESQVRELDTEPGSFRVRPPSQPSAHVGVFAFAGRRGGPGRGSSVAPAPYGAKCNRACKRTYRLGLLRVERVGRAKRVGMVVKRASVLVRIRAPGEPQLSEPGKLR